MPVKEKEERAFRPGAHLTFKSDLAANPCNPGYLGGRSQGGDQFRLQTEFKAILGNLAKSCLKESQQGTSFVVECAWAAAQG